MQLIKIAENMELRGGSFAMTLGRAMRLADDDNIRRIERAFPELMNRYTDDKTSYPEAGE
jgi:hypothetical protein